MEKTDMSTSTWSVIVTATCFLISYVLLFQLNTADWYFLGQLYFASGVFASIVTLYMLMTGEEL